jgi:hypothetical protein
LGGSLHNIKGKGTVNIVGKISIPFILTAMLVSCKHVGSTPTMSQAEIMQTAISTVSTVLVATQNAMPTVTPRPRLLPTIALDTLTPLPTTTPIPGFSSPTPFPTIPSFTPLVFSDPSIPLSRRIVYYYLVGAEQGTAPEGTVRAIHLFAPAYTDETFTSDTAADLRRALEIILHEDARRIWESSELEIVQVTFRNGHANVMIEGQAFAAGDAQPCAASLQILMTVFANPSVQTATITLNKGPIGNLCFFGPPTPHQDDYLNDDLYTRAEIEKYIKGNAYVSP